MLIAQDSRGQLVNLLLTVPPKQQFTCPACQSPVQLKCGRVLRPHFAHLNLKNCQFFSEQESEEHLMLKSLLYRTLSKSETVTIEKVIPSIGQIADLFVNQNLALEVQCSRLSEKRLLERSQAYRKQGISVLWLLGEKLWLKNRLSPLQKQFLYFSENMGFYLWELDAKQQLIHLKYLIYEDRRGKVHYLVQSCPLEQLSLNFFRLPYAKQAMSYYSVKQDTELLTYIQRQLCSGSRYWLAQQEACYLTGDNLLTKELASYFPQVRPPSSPTGFSQISKDLSQFYADFDAYYQKQTEKSHQTLYPPVFYGKIKSLSKRKEAIL